MADMETARGGQTPGRNGTPLTTMSSGDSTRRWATRYLAKGGSVIPIYGSPEWARLADTDPIKVASCVRAAEAWRHDSDPEVIARRLRMELEAAEEESWKWTPEVVNRTQQSGQRLVAGTTYAGLCERRGEPERAERARAHERRMQALIEAEPLYAPLRLVPGGAA